MSKTGLVTTVSIIGIVAIVAISLPLTSAKAEAEHGNHGRIDMKRQMLEKIHS